ncbi:hypothetical protein IKQ26_08950 [bacterium]|nr:hypothetical protein [bacterium]
MNPSTVDKIEKFILNHVDSASTMLVLMGIIGTITSSVAQQIGIKANKNIPEDKKAFLINQERNDCMLSAGLTWLTGTSSKQIVKFFTNRGYLLNDNVRKVSDAIASMNGMTHKELAKTGFFNPAKTGNSLNISQYKGLMRRMERCREGISIIATIGAAILTTNLLVPILRNKLSKPALKSDETPKLSVKMASNLNSNKFVSAYPTYYSSSMKI